MRIATWNIGGGFVSSKERLVFDLEDIDYIIEEFKKINPDIVCLQEPHVGDNNDQPKVIADALGFGFVKTVVIADSHIKANNKLAISVISKYPIISSKFNKLINPNLSFIWEGKKVYTFDKGFVEVVINYEDKPVRILSGHMVPFHKAGKDFLAVEYKQIREQVEDIICREKNPTIVGADMNFEDIYKLIPNIFDNEFQSVIDDNLPTRPNGKKYDKIIISDDWKILDSKIIPGKADHYLCFADVELK